MPACITKNLTFRHFVLAPAAPEQAPEQAPPVSISTPPTRPASISRNDMDETKSKSLVDLNVKILRSLLKQIVASRDADPSSITKKDDALTKLEAEMFLRSSSMAEVADVITFPGATSEEHGRKKATAKTITLDPAVDAQLQDLVSNIADMYKGPNAFHNFEHAMHVTASTHKLLSRIENAEEKDGCDSFGVATDPLVHFTLVLAALIHDVDHPGVPNTQLVKENTRNAQIYKESIAEQHSLDTVWGLLMSKEYDDLRACIYSTEGELRRFRQVMVNAVLATDLLDNTIQTRRNERWEVAYSDDARGDDAKNRKATMLVEILIQAADVAHTMQQWQVYKQWNEKLFSEQHEAYKAGRADDDPSNKWYLNELAFFDGVVMPLAKKLRACGSFGATGAEFFKYAEANRVEWVRHGPQVVQEYIQHSGTAEF